MKINFIDLQRQYKKYKISIDRELHDVLDTSTYVLSSKVGKLEKKLTEFVGTKYAISCASGTDALILALRTLKIKPKDEIITTPFTFVATAEAIALLGAKPVFIDTKEDTFNIDPEKIESKINKRTKGIIAVDLFGQCADYDTINKIARKHKLFVAEDAAQSFGATYKKRRAGSLADIGCTSFFPAKPLGCYGDGGMIFTNSSKIAKELFSLRVHGQGKNKYDNILVGTNSRLDSMQAAVLLAKFSYFNQELKLRQKVAQRYNAALSNIVKTPIILGHNKSVFAQYCIRVNNRSKLISRLKKANIPTGIYYPKPLHLQIAFKYLNYKKGDFPISEMMAQDILALPMHPYLTKKEQDYIISCIKK